MKIKKGKLLLAGALSAAMAFSVASPGAAFASRAGSSGGDPSKNPTKFARWNIPDTPMTDTVWKNDQGDVVEPGTAGAKQYKVITTWAMAWSTSGPDFLGINNSSFYGNGGNGNANVTNATYGAQSTLLGVWASNANENPNAFNWNSWYNLYADEQTKAGKILAETDLACTTDSYDAKSGVFGPFKYRPEIVWLCNNLNATQTAQYVKEINEGKYKAVDDNGKATDLSAEDKTAVAVEGDSTYDPYVIQPVCTSPFTFIDSAYELAGYADKVIADTASKDGKYGETTVNASNVNWQNMNALPRSNRYKESPKDCALAVEKASRGSVYYTLSKIKDNTVKRKKVAYVTAAPGTVDDTHVAVAVYDYMENIGGAGLNGTASWSPLVVDQLGQDKSLSVYNKVDHSSIGAGAAGDSLYSVEQPSMTYSQYIADADDLANCDVVYAVNVAYSQQNWENWLEENTTTKAAKRNLDKVKVLTTTPYVCNGSNYTMDKLIYGCYALDSIYPELFGNLELSTYWYDKVYHIKSPKDEANSTYLQDAMNWAFSTATLADGVSIDVSGYDAAKTEAKFDAGLTYYNSSKGSDETIKRILASTRIGASSADSKDNYANFEPSVYWQNQGKEDSAKAQEKLQIISPAASITKTLSDVKDTNGNFKTFELAPKALAQGVTFSCASSDTSVADVTDAGVVTPKKTGKTTITITAKAEGYVDTTKKVALEIKGDSMSITAAKDTALTATTTGQGQRAQTTYSLEKWYNEDSVAIADLKLSAVSGKNTLSGAKFSFESNNEKVIGVESDKLVVNGSGTATVTVTAEAEGYENAKLSFDVTVKVPAQSISVTAASVSKSLASADATKPFSLGAKVTADNNATPGELSYKSSDESVVKVDANGNATATGKVGSATITITAKANAADGLKAASTTVKVTVSKAGNTLTVAGKTATLKVKKVKKKAQILAVSKVLAVSKNQGAVTYKKAGGNGKISINAKTGKVTVKKGLKKGTYKIKVNVTAAGTTAYNAVTKAATFTVKVK